MCLVEYIFLIQNKCKKNSWQISNIFYYLSKLNDMRYKDDIKSVHEKMSEAYVCVIEMEVFCKYLYIKKCIVLWCHV